MLIGETLQGYNVAGQPYSKTHSWWDCYANSDPNFPKTAFGYNTAAGVSQGFSYPAYSGFGVPPTNTNNSLLNNLESNHSGGSIVAFCDGHVIFFAPSDSVADQIYQGLVCPYVGVAPAVDESAFRHAWRFQAQSQFRPLFGR